MKRQVLNAIFFLFSTLALGSFSPARGAETAPTDLEGPKSHPVLAELYQLISFGVENHPDLRRMRSEMGVLEAMTIQAGTRNDPMLSFMLMNYPAPRFQIDDVPMTQTAIGWSRTFESYGKRKLKKKLARYDEELKINEIAQEEWDLASRISEKYFDLLRARAQMRVIEENIKLVDLLSETVEGKFGIGLVPQSEVLRTQLQRTRLESNKVRLEKKIETFGAMLAGLLGNPAGFDVDEIGRADPVIGIAELDVDSETLVERSLRRRPDFARMRLMIEKKETDILLARREKKSNYTLNASYGMRWGKRDFVTLGVMFPLQTNQSEKQDAKIEQKESEEVVIEDQIRTMENMVRTKISAVTAELERVEELIGIYSEGFIPQAEVTLDSHIASFGAEGAQFESLLKTQDLLFNLQTDLELLTIDDLALLTDLQLVTAGGFDPQPYLLKSAGTPAQGKENDQ